MKKRFIRCRTCTRKQNEGEPLYCLDCKKELGKRAKQANGKRCRPCSNRHRLTDPNYKSTHKKSMETLAKNPKWLEERRAILKRQRADPQWQRNNREALVRLHSNPVWKANQRVVLEKIKSDPEYATKQSKGFRKWLRSWSKSRTTIESKVLFALKESGIRFIEQKGFKGFFYDFYLPDQRILIEVDGCFWHGCSICGIEGYPIKVRNDAAKDKLACNLGMTLLRLPEHSINGDPDYVRKVLHGALTFTLESEAG